MPARDPDRFAVLRVVAEHRACRCGCWVVVLTPEGMPPRTRSAADADEAAYVVEYELDVIMSETGRFLATEYRLGNDCATCPHGPFAEAPSRRRVRSRRGRLVQRYKHRKGTHGTCPG